MNAPEKTDSRPLDETSKESNGKLALVLGRTSTFWCRLNVMWLAFNRNFLGRIHFKLG